VASGERRVAEGRARARAGETSSELRKRSCRRAELLSRACSSPPLPHSASPSSLLQPKLQPNMSAIENLFASFFQIFRGVRLPYREPLAKPTVALSAPSAPHVG